MTRKVLAIFLMCSAILLFYAQRSQSLSAQEVQALMDKYGKERLIDGIMRLRTCRITLLVNGTFHEFVGTPAPEFVTVETLKRDLEKAGLDVGGLEEIVRMMGGSFEPQGAQSQQEIESKKLAENQKSTKGTELANVSRDIEKNTPSPQMGHDPVGPRNAAIYYSQAFRLLRYPDSGEFTHSVEDTVRNGWKAGDREPERILKENEPCFREVKKGLPLDQCRFDSGGGGKYLLFHSEFPPMKALRLSDLMLLKGRYYEKEKDFENATNAYLSTLTFAGHVSQENTMTSKIVSLAIERKTYAPLRDYLNSKRLDKRTCQRIVTQLDAFDKNHFPAKEIIEAERVHFMSVVNAAIDDLQQKVRENSGQTPEAEKFAKVFRQVAMKQAHKMADQYYGNFIKAAETNDKKDWELAISELKNFKKAQRGGSAKINVSKLTYDAFTGDMEGFSRELANMILLPLLAVPNFRKIVDDYYAAANERRDLKSLAKARLGSA